MTRFRLEVEFDITPGSMIVYPRQGSGAFHDPYEVAREVVELALAKIVEPDTDIFKGSITMTHFALDLLEEEGTP